MNQNNEINSRRKKKKKKILIKKVNVIIQAK